MIMIVNLYRLVAMADNFVRGVTGVVEVFRCGPTEFMNQLVACVGGVDFHNYSNIGEANGVVSAMGSLGSGRLVLSVREN